jgi:hypothetical protein
MVFTSAFASISKGDSPILEYSIFCLTLGSSYFSASSFGYCLSASFFGYCSSSESFFGYSSIDIFIV